MIMKNKNIFLVSIIRNSILVILLFVLFFCNQNIAKLILSPFILCGLAMIGRDICFLLNKEQYANIFKKLYTAIFLIFCFAFLVVWSYFSIQKGNVVSSIVITAFFAIVLIGIIGRKRIKINTLKIKKSPFSFPFVMSFLLISITLVIGVVCLFWGIKETYELSQVSKNYITTNGYFVDYHIYHSDEEGVTYQLTYAYEVDGENYTVSTTYGSNYIPEKNSIREVKYDPNNPKEAMLTGMNDKSFLIYFGGFFTLGSLTFIIAFLSTKGVFDKVKWNVMGFYFGLVFLVIGIGFICFQIQDRSSLLEVIKSLGLWSIIPILFIIVGGIQMIKSLKRPKEKMENIEENKK